MFKALSKMLRSIDKANHNGKLYVGKDSYGNMFYELTPMTQGGRRKRIYEPPNDGTDPQLSITQEVSAQWRSWLNGTRKDAPTGEDMKNELLRREYLSANVKKLELEFREEQVRLIGEAAVADRELEEAKRKHNNFTDHASSWDNARKSFVSESRRGDNYSPQGWLPAGDAESTAGTNKAKSNTNQQSTKKDDWTPGEWVP